MQTTHQNSAARDQELAALLHGIAGGDQAAFTSFYEMTNEFVHQRLLRGLKNAAEVEEALSDVYLHVWRRAVTARWGRSRRARGPAC